MSIEETDYYMEMQGVDNNGPFSIVVQKDCSQITIENGSGNCAFIDTNRDELVIIRDIIDNILSDCEINQKIWIEKRKQ